MVIAGSAVGAGGESGVRPPPPTRRRASIADESATGGMNDLGWLRSALDLTPVLGWVEVAVAEPVGGIEAGGDDTGCWTSGLGCPKNGDCRGMEVPSGVCAAEGLFVIDSVELEVAEGKLAMWPNSRLPTEDF